MSKTFIIKPENLGNPFKAIVKGDCLDILGNLKSQSVKLVHSSPPYNINRNYQGFRDSKDKDEYKEFLSSVAEQLYRIMEVGGSVLWQVGYTKSKSKGDRDNLDISLLDVMSLPIFEKAGFRLWDRIIWNYFGSMAFKSKFTNRHESILWFVKPSGKGDLSPTFNLDSVREKSVSYDGRNHLLGKNPGNVWASERIAFGSVGQTSHIAVFPEEISEKIIRTCSFEDDLVLDPFSGSGTTLKVALSLGRQFLGCELSNEYVKEIDRRLRMWGQSEVDNLALGLLVQRGFDSKIQKKSISHLAKVLDVLCSVKQLPEKYLQLEESTKNILEADRITKEVKKRKQKLWEEYDKVINEENFDDPIISADRALAFCFAHRKRWNGVRRYSDAGLNLLKLNDRINEYDSIEEYLEHICEHSNLRFSMKGSYIECLTTDAGLGCNGRNSSSINEENGEILQLDL